MILLKIGATALALVAFGSQVLLASVAEPHAPNFSVHESLYGTELCGKQRLSVEKITIRLYSHAGTNIDYAVQCFFLKKGKPGEPPQINDTVLFEVTSPRASYEVTAKPIKLSAGEKTVKSAKKGSKKSSAKKTKPAKPSPSDFPREGYIVRVLCNGVVVRSQASNHPLERLSKEDPELLDQAAHSKSARHLAVTDLVKKRPSFVR